jgi:hypothetical protein
VSASLEAYPCSALVLSQSDSSQSLQKLVVDSCLYWWADFRVYVGEYEIEGRTGLRPLLSINGIM